MRTLPPHPEVWQEEFGVILSDEEIATLCALKKPIPFVIWNGQFWRQYGFGKPAKSAMYPADTLQALQNLSLQELRKFFINDFGVTFSEEYYCDILERRDQVIQEAWKATSMLLD
jgi:hypothetical protein